MIIPGNDPLVWYKAGHGLAVWHGCCPHTLRTLNSVDQGPMFTDGKLPGPGSRLSRLNKSVPGGPGACSHSELCIGELSFIQQKPL